MKEYKFYKSTTLTNIYLPGNSSVIFDLANKNKENIMLTTKLYASKYYFPIMLSLIRKLNDEEVTPFGKGVYLNILYKLQKGNTKITIYYPHGESEIFKKSEDKETISDTEYNEYYYSSLTTNMVVINIKDNIIQKYTFKVGGLKIEFLEKTSETTLLNSKIYYNSTGTYYISLIYNDKNQICEVKNSLQNNEKIEFIYENNYCTALKAYKWLTIDGNDIEKLISNIKLLKDNNGSITIVECLNDCENYQRKATLMVSLDSQSIQALDYISNLSITINLSGNVGHQYIQKISYPMDELVIQYLTDYKTHIINNNNEVTYYLNENYDLLYISSSEGYVQTYKYETSNRYGLLSISRPLLKLLENNGELILEGEHEYDFEYQKITDSTCPGGSICHKIRFNNDAESTSAKIHFPVEGGKFDVLNLVMWSSVAEIINENLELTAKLYLVKNAEIRESLINEDILIKFKNNQWYLNIATIQAKEDYDEVILEIKPKYLSGDLINFNFGLFKKSLTTLYKYDDKGKIKKILNGFNNYNYGFNKDNQELVNNYLVNSYQDKKVVLSENFRKVKEEMNYNEIDNLIYHGYTNSNSDKIFSTYDYALNEYMESYNDYIRRKYNFEYNTYLLKKETFNDKSKTYEYNTNDDAKYNLLKTVIHKNNDTKICEESYIINNKQYLTSIQQKYGNKSTWFSYNYDSFNRLTSIYMDYGVLVYRCNYDEKGRIIREYCDNNNYIEYVYNTYNQLTKVKINGVTKYSFTYKDNLLTEIKNEDSGYYDVYTYDDDQKIIKYTKGYQFSPISTNNLMYDINGYCCGEQIIVDAKSITNEYSSSNNIDMKSPIGFEYYLLSEEDELYFTLMNDRQYFYKEYHIDYSPVLISRNKQLLPLNIKNYNGTDCYEYENHGLRLLKLNGIIPVYSFDKDVKFGNKYSIFFGMIVTSEYQSSQLFTLNGKDSFLSIVKNNSINNEILFSLYKGNERLDNITIKINELLNKLHFISINVESNKNINNKYDYKFTIYVDGYHKGSINGTIDNELYALGAMGSCSQHSSAVGKLTSIIINPNNNMSEEKIKNYVNKLSDIYNNNGNLIADYDMTINIPDFKYDYFPLNNSFDSIKGIKPRKFKCNNKTESLYDNFTYDKDITGLGFGHYVYALKNQELEYTLPINKSGTIGFKYKTIEGKGGGLLSFIDEDADFLFVLTSGQNGRLTSMIGTSFSVYTPAKPFEWNDVLITWSKGVQSSSIENLNYTFKLYINKELMAENNLTLKKDLANITISLGSSEGFDGEIKTNGYIQKLFYTSEGDIDPESIYDSFNNYSCKVNEYDEFLKIKNKIIKTTSNNVIKENYLYNNIYGMIIPVYNSKYLSIDNEIKRVETINLDEYGRIVEYKEVSYLDTSSAKFDTILEYITNFGDDITNQYIFAYDSKNQLIKAGNTNYEYDDLGNLKRSYNNNNFTKTFSYEGTKLIKYNDITFLYNGLYISKEVDSEGNILKEYTWDCSKLIEIKDYINNKKYIYLYNAHGLRERKKIYTIDEVEDVMEENICYYYNVKQLLVGETRDIYSEGLYSKRETIEYLYDGRNELYGFTYNGSTYYYVKDILGNIESIYDTTGANVAKYIYEAYGQHSVCYSNGSPTIKKDFIGYINRLRFKGYYYDVETGLFWLSSRYYSPELCRFISPDSIEYLDPSSINGLNLYVYCMNDPINYADPSGHVAISIGLLLAIGGIVGAAIGAGASVAGQYLANGCSWENFSWGQLALDTVLGGVSGMLSMSPLGWGTMIAANAGIGFVGAVGGHLINGSDFSKLSTWVDIGLSTGLGALVGVVGGPGALNAGYLNGAKQTAGFIRAAGLYDDVLTKAVTGFYRTPGIASNALRLSGQNLVKQWNKMVVSQAGKALTKALAYGGIALLIGTAGKGWLYDWYNDYF